VAKDDGRALADSLGLLFFETSAKDTTNVDTAFATITSDIKLKV
jgi:hypothetical protein